MTEQEWLVCSDPGPMLGFLRGKASDRKLRLFACACWRRLLRIPAEKKRIRQAIEAGERYLDRIATHEEIAAAVLPLAVGTGNNALGISGDATHYALSAAQHVANLFGYYGPGTELDGGVSRDIIVYSHASISITEEAHVPSLVAMASFEPGFRAVPPTSAHEPLKKRSNKP